MGQGWGAPERRGGTGGHTRSVDLAGSVPGKGRPGLGKGASRPGTSAHQTGTVQPPTAVPCRREHWGAGSTRGPPGAREEVGFPSASPRFQLQPRPKLNDTDSALAEPPRGAPLRLRPSPRLRSTSRENCVALPARFPSALPAAGFWIFFFFRLLARKKKNREGQKALRSLLARFVSGHLAPAPDSLRSGSQGREVRCLGFCRSCCPGWYFLPPPQRVRDVDPGWSVRMTGKMLGLGPQGGRKWVKKGQRRLGLSRAAGPCRISGDVKEGCMGPRKVETEFHHDFANLRLVCLQPRV